MPENAVIRRPKESGATPAGRRESRLPEDLRALSLRIRRSEKARERMTGRKHD